MSLFSRLFKRSSPEPETCPRCLGKGHVDENDIARLNRQGKWSPGVCAYCEGVGAIDGALLDKVAPDATWLITNLTPEERDLAINNTWLDGCPVSEIDRRWLENAFALLVNFFGAVHRALIPHYTDFPIKYDGSEQTAYDTMRIVAEHMEVPAENIQLIIFEDEQREVATGSRFGERIFLEGNDGAGGLYWGRSDDGRYEIWLNRSLLTQPESMVATLAHEIAHIKLLGEERMDKNDEHLTDLTTVVFGLGVFNANAAFQIIKTATSHGWSKKGYLTQMQWGYALALFAHVRQEQTPAWIDHLTRSIKKDFLQAQGFIRDNPEKIGV